jgi:GTPase SAR1 family protein
VLVGNKCDLAQSRIVSSEEAEAFAKTHELTYVETSALDGTGIETVFHRTAQDLLKKVIAGEVSAGTRPAAEAVRVSQQTQDRSGCAC